MNKRIDNNEYFQVVSDMNYLIYCIINGKAPDKEKANNMNLDELFKAANKHMLTSITAMALEKAGVQNYDFTQALGNAVKKNGTLDMEKRKIFKQLEEKGIWYMPLKGSVLKDYYPQFGMRQMSDIDVLFDSQYAEKVREIMENFGFHTKEFGDGHHDVYFKQPVSNFEMHWKLFGPHHDERMNEYYNNTKDRLVKDSNNQFGYHFTNEDFYIFMTAHEYKHYQGNGTGLRSVLDVYVFMKKFGDTLDMNYIESELAKMGIAEFEKQMRQLAINLYGKNEVTDTDCEMYNFVVYAGTYGSMDSLISSRIKKTGSKGLLGKIKYVWNRLFPPIENMRQFYPQFFENKLLLPLLPFYRISRIFTVQKDFVKSELKALFKYKGNF